MLDIHYTVCSVIRLSTIFGFGCATRTVGLKGHVTSTTHQHSPVVNKNLCLLKKSLFRKAGLLKLMSRESYQHLHQETILTLHPSTSHCAEEKPRPDAQLAKCLLPHCGSGRRHLRGQTCNCICLNMQDGLGCHPCA